MTTRARRIVVHRILIGRQGNIVLVIGFGLVTMAVLAGLHTLVDILRLVLAPTQPHGVVIDVAVWLAARRLDVSCSCAGERPGCGASGCDAYATRRVPLSG